jgi:Raf kinase inhibitor-like YbhB/YbcL family protein
MQLTSSDFKSGGGIPSKFTCDGADVSPSLTWSQVPENAKSFALIMDDPDAPVGTWVHWIIYDIPAEVRGLPPGMSKAESLPDGSKQGSSWGVKQFDRVGYGGPCPPPGKPHRYFFKLYALDRMLSLSPRATVNDLETAMKGHVLAQTQLMGLFGH